jgi:hypothetical protein
VLIVYHFGVSLERKNKMTGVLLGLEKLGGFGSGSFARGFVWIGKGVLLYDVRYCGETINDLIASELAGNLESLFFQYKRA